MRDAQRYNGEVNIQPYQKKASTVFADGDVVYVDSDGFLDKAGASTPVKDILGAIQRDVLATDTDYADNSYVPVDVFRKGDKGDWFTMVVGNGTPAQTDVGETHDLDSSGQVDLDANVYGHFTVQKIIDSTTVIVSFNESDQPALNLQFAGTFTTAGGDDTESIAVTGVVATDLVIVMLKTEGATPRTVDRATAATDAITVTMSGDPSTDHVLQYFVYR